MTVTMIYEVNLFKQKIIALYRGKTLNKTQDQFPQIFSFSWRMPAALTDLSPFGHSTGEKLTIKPGTTITFGAVKTQFHLQSSQSLTDGFHYTCMFQNEISGWDLELV